MNLFINSLYSHPENAQILQILIQTKKETIDLISHWRIHNGTRNHADA